MRPPQVRDLPIGIDASGTRRETDSMGEIDVPADRYWGAQTQRSLIHFSIGDDRMPKEVYHAYGYVKKAAALVNARAGRLPQWKADAIVQVCRRGDRREARRAFPALRLADRLRHAVQHERQRGASATAPSSCSAASSAARRRFIPNDDVNMGQSSNDTFPTAMHIAAVLEIDDTLLPRVDACCTTAIEAKAQQWMDVVKIGRTHLEDAVPLTVGQEWSGWAAQLDDARPIGSRRRKRAVPAGRRRHRGRHRPERAAGLRRRDRRRRSPS